MKTTKLILALLVLLTVGCGKNENKPDDQEDPEESRTLTDIVSQAYLDEVKTMGFTIHTGSSASAREIGGDYLVAPYKHDASNFMQTVSVDPSGFTISIMVDQNGGELFVGFSNEGHSSFNLSKPFMIGAGKNFTICRHRDVSGIAYAQLISGTKEGNALKNVKLATIRLANGDINIYSDADGTSSQQP